MLYRALSRVAGRTGLILGVFLLSTTSAHAQSMGSGVPDVPWPEPLPSLKLTAEQRTGARLEIVAAAGDFSHATGILTIEGQTWRTNDRDCERFRNALTAFQFLPTLRPGPGLLLSDASPNNELPPLRRHAVPWSIRTQLHAPDRTTMDVEMRGAQGPYAKWLDDTVQIIKGCNSTPPE